jgi:hypothetical protein
MRCAHGSLTLVEVKAATVIVKPEPGRTITVHDGWLRAIGGNAATASGVVVEDTAGVDAFVMAVAGLAENVVARVGVATHYTGTTIGSPLTPGKGLRIDDAGGVLAGPTTVDYAIFYTVES